MTAQIIRLADMRAPGLGYRKSGIPKLGENSSADTWNHPTDNETALTRVLLHRIALNLGLPLKPEDYGFLHRYGHLAR